MLPLRRGPARSSLVVRHLHIHAERPKPEPIREVGLEERPGAGSLLLLLLPHGIAAVCLPLLLLLLLPHVAPATAASYILLLHGRATASLLLLLLILLPHNSGGIGGPSPSSLLLLLKLPHSSGGIGSRSPSPPTMLLLLSLLQPHELLSRDSGGCRLLLPPDLSQGGLVLKLLLELVLQLLLQLDLLLQLLRLQLDLLLVLLQLLLQVQSALRNRLGGGGGVQGRRELLLLGLLHLQQVLQLQLRWLGLDRNGHR